MFRCVDLEGGTVDRLRDAVAHAPALGHVAAIGSPKAMRRFASMLGEEARALGFNTDFAPVLDLAHGSVAQRPRLSNDWRGS